MTTDELGSGPVMIGSGRRAASVGGDHEDVSFRIVPLTERDAEQMMGEIKGSPVLDGVRGQAPADKAALRSAILKVADFVQAHPEVRELDLNPMFAYPDGALAVDARIVVSES